MLCKISPEFCERIYCEVKAEANLYGENVEYERLSRVNRLLLKGISEETVFEAVKQHNENLLECALLLI